MSEVALLVVDPDPTGRLVALDTLRAHFQISAADVGEAPLRVVRRERPEVVLVVLRSVRIEAVVQLCRRARSELELHTRLVLWNAPVVRELRRLAEEQSLAEGYLEGGVSTDELLEACLGVSRGERVDIRRPAEGRVGAWVRGLMGS